MVKKMGRITYKGVFLFFLPAVLITIGGFVVAYQFVEPSPPRNISIATGEPGGAYFTHGKVYKKLLEDYGITLTVRETEGSLENLKLLEKEIGGVDIAFIQGGIGRLSDSKTILSIGSLYYEPLWIFYRSGVKASRISDLKGLRIAIGNDLSGTKVLASDLLSLNGITQGNTQFVSQGPRISANMLLKHEIDAVFFVSTHKASYISDLLGSKSVFLMGIERAAAYKLRYSFLNVIDIPQGVIDFVENIPARNIQLLAPTAQLAVRSDLHPALIDLVLQTARRVHMPGGGLEKKGEFPSPKYLDFELSEDAHRFYTDRVPFLRRHFPFWVATFLGRMKIMILPFIAIMFPLFKIMPWIYRWRMRARIYRWYSDLDELGTDLYTQSSPETHDDYMAKMDALEKKALDIQVPKPYAESLFNLRMHIGIFRKKLMNIQKPDEHSKTLESPKE